MIFKILNWNINSIRVRSDQLLNLIAIYNPDIICLQELKCTEESFPYNEFQDLAYNIYINGQKSYNGVAILSKFTAEDIKIDFCDNPCVKEARFIKIIVNTPIGFINIISLYAPNGGEINSNKFQLKIQFFESLIKYLNNFDMLEEKTLLCGDLNIAPFNIDVYDANALKNTTCFTLTEKQQMRSILNMGFIDNFRLNYPKAQEFSWWDYRKSHFKKNLGYRIDFILSSANLVEYFRDIVIEHNTRKLLQASDHAPLISTWESK
ncbi:exodeoxyribonuclease III [Rickettsia endosymbiont of Cardiosporidium cionae]|uniref:exodeoxyribonuclease III n=1 Tax=Rickettsia endosymbiont of Cardiosporidium cionae TaxID=2777155 RepID=UPI001893EE35|nr:exodeoxyribonuclease III [Rickettsia endosymbiont of Cardiosporidium cionae]KAF8818438.1 exodeoxyribonuclease III [Rickettsia endosymbiont of Cardiosporidium cionae]